MLDAVVYMVEVLCYQLEGQNEEALEFFKVCLIPQAEPWSWVLFSL
jgi:hypothetical protein